MRLIISSLLGLVLSAPLSANDELNGFWPSVFFQNCQLCVFTKIKEGPVLEDDEGNFMYDDEIYFCLGPLDSENEGELLKLSKRFTKKTELTPLIEELSKTNPNASSEIEQSLSASIESSEEFATYAHLLLKLLSEANAAQCSPEELEQFLEENSDLLDAKKH